MPRTALSNNLILAIYAEHEDAIARLWGDLGDEDDSTTMRDAVEEWLARQLVPPVEGDDL